MRMGTFERSNHGNALTGVLSVFMGR